MDDEVIFQLVTPGEAARLLKVYEQATAGARTLRTALARAGVDTVAAQVVPAVSEAGTPVVHLRLTIAWSSGRSTWLACCTPCCPSTPTSPGCSR